MYLYSRQQKIDNTFKLFCGASFLFFCGACNSVAHGWQMRHRYISVAHHCWCTIESWYFCGAPWGCATEIYFSGEISVAHPTISWMRHRIPILGGRTASSTTWAAGGDGGGGRNFGSLAALLSFQWPPVSRFKPRTRVSIWIYTPPL